MERSSEKPLQKPLQETKEENWLDKIKHSIRQSLFGLKKEVEEERQPEKKEQPIDSDITDPFPEECSAYWDKEQGFFSTFENGEFSKKERQKRTEKLGKGVVVFRDIGLTFYLVQKGDTIWSISQKLSKYPEFAYLKELDKNKLKSFNIPPKKLQIGMLIPIPLPEENRVLTDEQFAHYCYLAIREMENHPVYGQLTQELIKITPRKGLIKLMLAVAKQESGGKPLGQFEFHRWEPAKQSFSFSIFHVLMKHAGLRARQKLDLTEGQLYHPKNAAKLFLAFLFEKTGGNAHLILPLENHLTDFAKAYNGGGVKSDYIAQLKQYYEDANILLSPQAKLLSESRLLAQNNRVPEIRVTPTPNPEQIRTSQKNRIKF